MIYHLVYVSTASSPFDKPRLEDLLAQSRRANAAVAITGFLAYSGGNFMQLLEGAPPAVQDVYDRIALDRRHYNVTRLLDCESADRWCKDWAMAYADKASKQDIDGFVNLTLTGGKVLSGLDAAHIARRLLQGFIDGNR